MHHSDPGVQHDSTLYRQRLRDLETTQSTSRRRDCYGNAAVGSFFASLESESVGTEINRDLLHARDEATRYIKGLYTPRRLNSALGDQPPDEFRRMII